MFKKLLNTIHALRVGGRGRGVLMRKSGELDPVAKEAVIVT